MANFATLFAAENDHRMLESITKRLFGDARRLVLKPPMPLQDRSGVGLVAIVKNEERHILDWLIFHAVAGVREIVIYDNGSTDRTAEIASGFRSCQVTVIPWTIDIGISRSNIWLKRQNLAYAHATCNFGARLRWIAFLDVDEYLVPLKADSIEAALADVADHPNIALPWTMFGTSGHIDPPKEPIPFAYEQRARRLSGNLLNFKCILDPCELIEIQVHKFRTTGRGGECMNDHGVRAETASARMKDDFAKSSALQLNHYFTFSKRELEEKIEKGAVSHLRADLRERKVRDMANAIDSDLVFDDAARTFLARHAIHNADSFRQVG